ncbi:hypothetical protein [Mycobacterium scrofulaceum]|uniref:hypothetical protein n=1 Tax=Mycobacterium scrofulaceum TaxID=1783 RepID=UPI001301F608|nr:hypothetical protein [Mycobacterium scrofulaceum]
MQFTVDLSDPVEQHIRELRRENAKFRKQRNMARRDLEAAVSRIAELHAELDALRAGR